MADRTNRSRKRYARPIAERRHHSDPMRRLGERVVIMGDCWVVNGEPDKYHQVYVHTTYEAAHRHVYAEVNDVILDSDVNDVILDSDVVIHHTCETKGCINPAHLQAVTPSDHSRIHVGRLDPADAVTPEGAPRGLRPMDYAARMRES